jgi:hypothetical protein
MMESSQQSQQSPDWSNDWHPIIMVNNRTTAVNDDDDDSGSAPGPTATSDGDDQDDDGHVLISKHDDGHVLISKDDTGHVLTSKDDVKKESDDIKTDAKVDVVTHKDASSSTPVVDDDKDVTVNVNVNNHLIVHNDLDENNGPERRSRQLTNPLLFPLSRGIEPRPVMLRTSRHMIFNDYPPNNNNHHSLQSYDIKLGEPGGNINRVRIREPIISISPGYHHNNNNNHDHFQQQQQRSMMMISRNPK